MNPQHPPYRRILLPTDGSDGARAAAQTALHLAERFDAHVHVVHVADLPELPPGIAEDYEGEIVEASRQLVAETEARFRDAGVTTSGEALASGDPVHEVLIDYGTTHDIDCIVMGTAGRSGLHRLALGSVAERTVRGAPMTVITVRPETSREPGLERILLPTDGSEGASAAVDHGIELARITDAGLSVLHVVSIRATGFDEGAGHVYDALQAVGQQAIEDVRDRADAEAVRPVEASLVAGRVDRAIVRHAEDRDIDAIVMGTHGRSGPERLWLGSVTERVMRQSPVPVITVKPTAVLEELPTPSPTYSPLGG